MSIREKILNATALQCTLVAHPLIGSVVLQVPPEKERAEIEAAAGKPDTVKRLVVVLCVKESEAGDHKPGDTWMEPPLPCAFSREDIAQLAKTNSTLIDDLANAALKLMKISREDMASLMGEQLRS